MAKFYRHYWDEVDGPPDVPLGPLKGGKLAKSVRAAAVHRGADTIPALGRPIVIAKSMAGGNSWQTGTVSAVTRKIGQAEVDIVPGYVMRLACLKLPSGDNTTGGAWGEIRVDVTWTDRDGDSTTTQHTLSLDGQDGDFSDTPWASLTTAGPITIAPSSFASISTLREWSRYTAASVTLSYNGNPRVVDMVLYQEPLSIALEADDSRDFWISGMLGSGKPDGQVPDLDWPVERLSETGADGNPRGGSWMLLDQARAQQSLMGPMLVSWNGHNESSDSVTAIEDNYVGGAWTSASWYRIPDGGAFVLSNLGGAVDANMATKGWGMAAGSYARPPRLNDSVAMANSGVVPVRVHCYVRSNGGGTSPYRLRVYTRPHSYVEVSGTAVDLRSEEGGSGPDAIPVASAYGYLKCGRGPGDAVRAVAVAQPTSGTNGLRVYGVVVRVAQYARAT